MQELINRVIIVKLVTSEEIIGKLIHVYNRSIVIHKPRVITPVRTSTGIGLVLMPFVRSLSDDTNVEIYQQHLLTEPVIAPKENYDTYLEETTGIQFATPSTLLS